MKKMKNPLAILPPKARPYAMLVLAMIPLLAVWAVYDDVVRRQASEIERLRSYASDTAQVPASDAEPTIAPKPAGSAAPSQFAAPTTDWRTVTSPDGSYQVSLPPGTKIVLSEGVTYVMADPTPRGALPIMVIKIPSAPDKQGYKPGTSTSVMLTIGTQSWWLYTWQYKAWASFDRVVSSFKILE
ncbi:MAG: hypothetical protein AAB554_03600 [Patescibacteria group bacterium]